MLAVCWRPCCRWEHSHAGAWLCCCSITSPRPLNGPARRRAAQAPCSVTSISPSKCADPGATR